MKICLGEVDQTQVRHLLSAKEKWESLKKKYIIVFPTTGCKYFNDFIIYKKSNNISILEAWQYLYELKRKVV